MATEAHSAQTVGDGIHIIKAYEHGSSGARTGASYASTDIGKVSHQTDDDSFWLVKTTAPAFIELTDDMGGDVSGKQGSATVTALRGITIETGTPTDGDVLTYNSTSGEWEHQVASGGSTPTYPQEIRFRHNRSSANWCTHDGFGPVTDDIWQNDNVSFGAIADGDPTFDARNYACITVPFACTIVQVNLHLYTSVDSSTTQTYFSVLRNRPDWGTTNSSTNAVFISKTALSQVGDAMNLYSTDASVDGSGSARLSLNAGSGQSTLDAGDQIVPFFGTTSATDSRGTITFVIEAL